VQPGQNWSGQYSFAHLTSPEALQPNDDIQRMTASIMYNRPLAHGNWASTLLWGRNRVLQTGLVWNGYLAESTLRFAQRNYIWGRIENVDRTNELLLKNEFEPPDFQESIIGRVQAYTAGYDHDFSVDPSPGNRSGRTGHAVFHSRYADSVVRKSSCRRGGVRAFAAIRQAALRRYGGLITAEPLLS
jgi:hypothetical protein